MSRQPESNEPPAAGADEEQRVEVWSFRRYDGRAGQYVASIGKATVEAIARFGADAVPESMEQVPEHALDVNGIYTPPRTLISAAARRRLERLRTQYAGLLADEDHERLEGWSDRVDALSAILQQIDDKLAAATAGAGA
jgi:hypothetical protein